MYNFYSVYEEKLSEYDIEHINILVKLLMNNIIIEYISINNLKKNIENDIEYLFLKSKISKVYKTLINKLNNYYDKQFKKIRKKMTKYAKTNNIEFIKIKVYYDMLNKCMQTEKHQLILLKKKNIKKLLNECINEKICSKIKNLNNIFSNKIKKFHIDYYKSNKKKYNNNIDIYINHIKNLWNID